MKPATLCPVRKCTRKRGAGKLVCYSCFCRLPREMGRRLYAAWADGAGAGTPAYEAVVAEVLAFLAPKDSASPTSQAVVR